MKFSSKSDQDASAVWLRELVETIRNGQIVLHILNVVEENEALKAEVNRLTRRLYDKESADD